MSERTDLLLSIADDELFLGWRNSEWTGIAPFLEEDVAFSSIAQNEIGHARALYELAAAELGTTADELAFDRKPDEYRCAPLVQLRRLEWARTIARHWLYETADEIRLAALKSSDDPEIAGIAAKMDREEAYHRMHAEMWIDRLLSTEEGRARLDEAVDELWPYALGVLDDELRPELRRRAEERLGRELPGRRARVARRPRGRARAALGGDDDGPALGSGGCAMVTADDVWAALAEIPDPEIPVISLVDLGVIKDVEVEDGTRADRVHADVHGLPGARADATGDGGQGRRARRGGGGPRRPRRLVVDRQDHRRKAGRSSAPPASRLPRRAPPES